MKRHRSLFLAAGAIVALMSVGLQGAAADSSHRPSHTVPDRSSGRAAPPRRAADGRFFQGNGGAVDGPFSLQGGRYDINVLSTYNSLYDAGASGSCLFTAYLNGVEKPQFVSLGTAIPVLASSPYLTTLAVTFPAGHQKLIVSPTTNCTWSITILRHGPSVPGIEIVGAQSYLIHGTTLTPTTVVHMGQSFEFFAFYRLVGGLKGTPKGTITFQEHAGPPQPAPLVAVKDANGLKQMGVTSVFSLKTHDTLGPAVATFAITVGTHHVSESLHFTVAR